MDRAPSRAPSNASVVTRDVLGYADPVVVGTFAAAQSQLNAVADVGLYNQIDTLLWQDLPTLPLFQMPTALVRQVEIVNVSDTATPAGPMWNAAGLGDPGEPAADDVDDDPRELEEIAAGLSAASCGSRWRF